MWNKAELRPGGAYLLDDFTVIQVVAVEGGHVRYRTRAWGRRVVLRRIWLSRLEGRIRAEVNGQFFPDIALPGPHRFVRPAAEAKALRAHLDKRAARRPFAGS